MAVFAFVNFTSFLVQATLTAVIRDYVATSLPKIVMTLKVPRNILSFLP